MSVSCSNVLWPQSLHDLAQVLPSSNLPRCSAPCSLYSQPCWLQCGPLSVLGVVMPHSIFLLLLPLLGTFFPRCSHGPFPYLLQISDQISNVLERLTWLPNLKLQHLHKAATSLVSFPNLFFFQVFISVWYANCFMYLLFSAPFPSPTQIRTLHKGSDGWNLST